MHKLYSTPNILFEMLLIDLKYINYDDSYIFIFIYMLDPHFFLNF